MERAELLARCTDEPGELTRLYGTPAPASASDTLAALDAAWLGMTVRRTWSEPHRGASRPIGWTRSALMLGSTSRLS